MLRDMSSFAYTQCQLPRTKSALGQSLKARSYTLAGMRFADVLPAAKCMIGLANNEPFILPFAHRHVDTTPAASPASPNGPLGDSFGISPVEAKRTCITSLTPISTPRSAIANINLRASEQFTRVCASTSVLFQTPSGTNENGCQAHSTTRISSWHRLSSRPLSLIPWQYPKAPDARKPLQRRLPRSGHR